MACSPELDKRYTDRKDALEKRGTNLKDSLKSQGQGLQDRSTQYLDNKQKQIKGIKDGIGESGCRMGALRGVLSLAGEAAAVKSAVDSFAVRETSSLKRLLQRQAAGALSDLIGTEPAQLQSFLSPQRAQSILGQIQKAECEEDAEDTVSDYLDVACPESSSGLEVTEADEEAITEFFNNQARSAPAII